MPSIDIERVAQYRQLRIPPGWHRPPSAWVSIEEGYKPTKHGIPISKTSKLVTEITETKDIDMQKTIEVTLNSALQEDIKAKLKELSMNAEASLSAYQAQAKKYTNDPAAAVIIEYLQSHSKEHAEVIRIVDNLVQKLSSRRPVKLTKKEQKVLSKVTDKVSISMDSICPGSKVSSIDDPDRFFMFPHLKKRIEAKLEILKDTLSNLTRSDVNVVLN